MGEGLVDKLRRDANLDLNVTWLPFELHPETPAAGVDLASSLGIPPARLAAMHQSLRDRAGELGLPMEPPPHIVNSHRALLLSEWVREHSPALLDTLHHALFQAYFVAGENLAADAVLRQACAQAGVDADRALAEMQDERFEQRLADAMELSRAYGVNGAPTWIINNRYKVVGAQPYEALRDALRRIAAEQG